MLECTFHKLCAVTLSNSIAYNSPGIQIDNGTDVVLDILTKNVYISSFIPEVLEIIRLAQPILSADLIQLYKDIKGIDTFTFIKRNGEAFSREIQATYIWKMLEVAQIVRIDEGYLSLLNYSKTQNFMLRYSGNAMDRERNRIICRKYRYGEKV